MVRDILDMFIGQARKNIANGYYNSMSKEKVEKKSLLETLGKNKLSLISEIKHASPAGEYSFDNIDVEKTAISFRNNGADAISVVVEPKIFKGSLCNIPVAKKAGLPVLFKDFVLDEVQINAAHNSGADCVLLVMRVLDRTKNNVDEMIAIAHGKGLEVLLECYDEKEFEMALETDAEILGINNRDLQTLKVDLNRTKNILEKYGSLKKPVISESGVKTRQDAEFLRECGAKGILVGTALWTANNQEDKIRELRLE